MEPVSRVPPSVGVGVEKEKKNKTRPDVAGISPRDRRLIPDQDVLLASGKRAIAQSMPALKLILMPKTRQIGLDSRWDGREKLIWPG